MLVKDFIKGPLISEIENMTIHCGNTAHAYLGFQLICLAIEFLGACLDQYPWEKIGRSEKRFKLGLNKLFNTKYNKYNNGGEFDLYSNLRCSLVHSSRPGNYIGLSQSKYNVSHLSKINGKLILVYEDFLKDFKEASKKLINLIDDKSINNSKVYSHILVVPDE